MTVQSAHFQNSIRLLHKLPHSDRRRFSRNRENQDTDSNRISYIYPNLSYIQRISHTRFQPTALTDGTYGDMSSQLVATRSAYANPRDK